jgi:hypothetical protein
LLDEPTIGRTSTAGVVGGGLIVTLHIRLPLTWRAAVPLLPTLADIADFALFIARLPATMAVLSPASDAPLRSGLVAIGQRGPKGLRQAWAGRVQIIIELPLFAPRCSTASRFPSGARVAGYGWRP